jgi:hypothetical protein
MDSLPRLLLRFVLVPLGYLAGVIVGASVILFGAWKLGAMAQSADPDMQMWAILGFAVAGPVLLVMLLGAMWLPAAIGILISETFAIRSFIFHALNGALSAWIGWHLFGSIDNSPVPLHDPLPVVAAGLAGGLAYWAVAGWSAGFWQPVFTRERPPTVPPSDPATTR